MKSKTGKTRDAEVRVSRAKSRVEASKRVEAKARRPKQGADTPAQYAPEYGQSKGVSPQPVVDEKPVAENRKGKRSRAGQKELESEKRRRAPSVRRLAGDASAYTAAAVKGKRKKDAATPSRSKTTDATQSQAGRPAGAASEVAAARAERAASRPARAVFLGVLLVASLAALLWVYTSTGVLNVAEVEVRGNVVLDEDYLRSLSGITQDTHLLKMNVKAVEEALLSEPYIARVDISRRYPNKVVLSITERRPTGFILQNGKYNLVDQEGMILESTQDRPSGLIEIKDLESQLLFPGVEISGMDFAAITSLLGSLPPALREMTTAVGLKEGNGLYLEGKGTLVSYGEAHDLSRKNTITLLALTGLVDRYGAIEYIDVSFPDHPVIKPAATN